MAAALWGNVYLDDTFAGLLQQEPSGRCLFTYDAAYLSARHPAIAHTLPLQETPHYCEAGLHPYFDNLVAEGWLRNAQARAIGVDRENRFALLLAFGRDCAGAISVIDPDPTEQFDPDITDPEGFAALASRASLSGVQPKILVIKEEAGYRPAQADETSTHIAKLPSGNLPDLIEIEWLTTAAARALLPGDRVVEMEIAPLGDVAPKALMIRRFDRRMPSGRKVHFEEFNQLLGKRSDDKYEGAYEDMAQFIRTTPSCIPAESERLFRRVLTCILTGNTDAHFKNFAMLHTSDGLRLAPSYDQVASALYPDYQSLALAIGTANDLRINALQPKHIIALGEAYGMGEATVRLAVEDLGKRLPAAKDAVNGAGAASADLGNALIDIMERRWNGTFASIGKLLSTRRGTGGRRRG